MVTQLIREARENKGNLSVLWLDLANAYGSIPHKLVELTLTKHHIPTRVRDLIADYYNNFRMRTSSGAVTSGWHKIEIGTITGCTISVILFSLAMNMLTMSAEPECRGLKTKSAQRQPPIRASMDDLTVTESVPGFRWILKGLEKQIEWARMCFKPAKSRSMVLRRGKVDDKSWFSVAGATVPTVTKKPVKILGKVTKAGIEVRTGRKWKAEGAVRQAEARLDHNRLVGVVARGRAGLGSFSTLHIDTIKGKERRRPVQEEVRAVVEEERTCRTVGMRQQGAWI